MSKARNVSSENDSWTRRLTALVYGIVCHLLFVAAVFTMALALFNGLRIGRGPFRGWTAAAANSLLLMSFPLFHSWLLSGTGRRAMVHLVPFRIGKELSTTIFVALSAAQLLAVFLLWTPSGVVGWEARGFINLAIAGGAVAAWLLLGKSMADAHLSLQTGFLGWSAVFQNRSPLYRPFSTRGIYRYVRQPIYISFALILWLSSVWTPDQLMLAALCSLYCLVGSALKERRYVTYFGEAFRMDQSRVPFWVPCLNPSKARTAPVRSSAPAAKDADVVIAGAGPVGLLLANLLGRRGLRVLVVERRTRPLEHSMAIGITPPSLAILKRLGLDGEFTSRGVSVETARAFENGSYVGGLDFSRITAEHRFILSIPQSETVRILQKNLRNLPSVELFTGFELVDLDQRADSVCVTLRDRCSGARMNVCASYLAGCDGHRSSVRHLAGIRRRTRAYDPRFLMADFDDRTVLHREARLYFGRDGFVESFPLPGGRRRWVVLTGQEPVKEFCIANEVVQRVGSQTGFDLSDSRVHSRSAFQPRWLLVKRYVSGRVALCGDAAHVMSPIGGQGMNTGFADAAQLEGALASALEHPETRSRVFARYHTARSRAFKVAANRSARAMWLGTRTGGLLSPLRRTFLVGLLLLPSIRKRLASDFAMITIPGNQGATQTIDTLGGAIR